MSTSTTRWSTARRRRPARTSTRSRCACSSRIDALGEPTVKRKRKDRRNSFKPALVALAGLAAVATGAAAGTISGAGATFPYPIYSKWAGAYQGVSGDSLNYQAIGSGGGIAQIKAKTVTFGASDMPLKPKDLDAAGLIMFPTVVGGVVQVINIKGVKHEQLVLD